MSKPPPLFDRHAIQQRRRRATDAGMFLQRVACSEMEERLKDVNRAFTKPAVISAFPAIWTDLIPHAKLIADSDLLDLNEADHDLVIDAMTLHWSNDPVGQLVQIRRALQPDGLFLGAMFGGQTLHELRGALAEAETMTRGGLSPRIAPMGEIRDLGALLQRAGFALPVADSIVQNVNYGSALDIMHDLREMGETNTLADRLKKFSSRHLFLETERIYQDAYGTPDGRIEATFEFIFLAGWSPAASQPQPLRPGSATARLADALNTTELGPDGKPAMGKKNH